MHEDKKIFRKQHTQKGFTLRGSNGVKSFGTSKVRVGARVSVTVRHRKERFLEKDDSGGLVNKRANVETQKVIFFDRPQNQIYTEYIYSVSVLDGSSETEKKERVRRRSRLLLLLREFRPRVRI